MDFQKVPNVIFKSWLNDIQYKSWSLFSPWQITDFLSQSHLSVHHKPQWGSQYTPMATPIRLNHQSTAKRPRFPASSHSHMDVMLIILPSNVPSNWMELGVIELRRYTLEWHLRQQACTTDREHRSSHSASIITRKSWSGSDLSTQKIHLARW